MIQFQNKVGDAFEIRYHKPTEQKAIKTNFYNINKIKMLASVSALLLQVLMGLLIYFCLDNPLTTFKSMQCAIYLICFTCPVITTLAQTIIYFTNKFKMVSKLDFKTNIFFKILFGMCLLSTLFIVIVTQLEVKHPFSEYSKVRRRIRNIADTPVER